MTEPSMPERAVREIVVSVNDALAAGALAEVARELPDPTSLAPGSWVRVRVVAPRPSLWMRLKHRDSGAHPTLAVACTALLAAGYARVSSDDSTTAYGCT